MKFISYLTVLVLVISITQYSFAQTNTSDLRGKTDSLKEIMKSDRIAYDACELKKGSLYVDDSGNFMCLVNYKFPSESHEDINIDLTLRIAEGKTVTQSLSKCTMLSANHGSHSLVCPAGSKLLLIANYQKGYFSQNRIWIQEITKSQLEDIESHEGYRFELKKGPGELELKPNDFERNKYLLSLFDSKWEKNQKSENERTP